MFFSFQPYIHRGSTRSCYSRTCLQRICLGGCASNHRFNQNGWVFILKLVVKIHTPRRSRLKHIFRGRFNWRCFHMSSKTLPKWGYLESFPTSKVSSHRSSSPDPEANHPGRSPEYAPFGCCSAYLQVYLQASIVTHRMLVCIFGLNIANKQWPTTPFYAPVGEIPIAMQKSSVHSPLTSNCVRHVLTHHSRQPGSQRANPRQRMYISPAPRFRLFFLPHHTIRVAKYHSTPLDFHWISRVCLPGPSQSFFCASNPHILSLPQTLFSSLAQSNPTSSTVIPSTSTHNTAVMFKRSFRTNDRVEKTVKLKKTSRDAAKLAKLKSSFDRSPAVGRYVACLPNLWIQTEELVCYNFADENSNSTLTSRIVTFTIGKEGRLFAAHEDVLALSPFFTTACRGQIRESQSMRIDLPDEEPEVFSCVLEYLYVCLSHVSLWTSLCMY
jgi:hypothetical protein